MTRPTTALSVRSLSKSFAGVPALRSVDLTVHHGTIHGLIGPNGSGKSTLVKLLAGFHRPDGPAQIEVNGQALTPPFTAAHATAAGLGFVHQDLALIEACSAAENLGFSATGFVKGRGGRIAWRRHHAHARELFSGIGLDIDPRAPVASLTPAERALVAIARAKNEFEHGREAVLVLDEPTATLPQHEVEILFRALRRLASQGAAILYISHRLPELLALTNAITVLRDGQVAGTVTTAETSEDDLATLMLGEAARDMGDIAHRDDLRVGLPLLAFDGVATATLAPTTIELHTGEILAVTGAVGAGGAELGRVLFGLTDLLGGSISLGGESFEPGGPRAAKAAGIGYLPADRKAESSLQQLTVAENILITDYGTLAAAGRLRPAAARREATTQAEQFDERPRDPERIFQTLSGGNQQKALLAKWLRVRPRALVIDEPTQGIDVHTRLEIHQRLRREADQGLGVLWITSDLEEASAVADRVAVFSGGALVEIFHGAAASPDALARASFTGASRV